ncbi:VENN motif pre-toxin domain-containing protein [Testudinibacter sp. P80/BLE/0925]|uniref:VENN motif pre-toxin domain-containing protein n=1 Tax=Testudinibacter sp. TW-1 TaxID=3417757 RepID=UPI003D35A0A8
MGAVEAQVNGGSALGGAAAGIAGEAAAELLAQTLYGKKASDLNEREKQNITALSSLTGALAAGMASNATNGTTNLADTLANAAIGQVTAESAVENNYLFKQELARQLELVAKRQKEGLTEEEAQELTDLVKLDHQRDKDLQLACYGGMTTACANELITLSSAFYSYGDPKAEIQHGEYKDIATQYANAKREYAEDVAREALVKIAKEGITDSVELATITAKAMTGDEVSQAQLSEMGRAIKAFAEAPITTISDNIKSQLAEADRLEASGQTREADVMRMQVYLSTELGVIGSTAGALNLVKTGAKSAVKLGKTDVISSPIGYPLTEAKINEILLIEKGKRPDPTEYLPKEYIDAHLSQFDDGAVRFIPESNFNKYGLSQRDNTAFVLSKKEADVLWENSNGNLRIIEKELGLPENYLSNNILRVDINEPHRFNLRIPSGNEAGVNEQWVPGGKLPNGKLEAIIDFDNKFNQYLEIRKINE